jgi:hypothetical protein
VCACDTLDYDAEAGNRGTAGLHELGQLEQQVRVERFERVRSVIVG